MNACNIVHSKSHSAFYNIKQIESNTKYVKKQNITLSAHTKKTKLHNLCSGFTQFDTYILPELLCFPQESANKKEKLRQ